MSDTSPNQMQPAVQRGTMTYLNFKQRMCKGPCKTRRSVGQFTHDIEWCDRCVSRKPKPG